MPSLTEHPNILLAVAGGVSLLLLFRRWFRPKIIPGIPHFPISSIWGDLSAITRDTETYGTFMEDEGFIQRAVTELGPVFQIFIGPFDTCVVIADVQEIEDILLRSKLQKAIESSEMTRAAFDGVMPEGMISLKTDDVWRRHRRITAPLMTSTYLNQMSVAISVNAQQLVNLWREKIAVMQAAGGTCFSSQSDFEYSTLDTISEIIAGRSINAIEHALTQLAGCAPQVDLHGGTTFSLPHQPLFSALRYFVGAMGTALQLPPIVARGYYAYLQITPTFLRHKQVVDDHIANCVNEARRAVQEAQAIGEDAIPARSLVGMVAQRENVPGQEKFSEKELRDEVLTFLLAVSGTLKLVPARLGLTTIKGHDTTSQSLQWCTKFFAKAPHVQRALRSELMSTLDDSPDKRPLTFADVSSPQRTPYLEAVVHEVLRCSRVAPATSKQTLEPVTILGYDIPAGTNVFFMNGVACNNLTQKNLPAIRAKDNVRSESSLKNGLGGRGIWDDPTTFDPERWLVDVEDGKKQFNPKAGVSIPFGVGLRACAGKALAILELRIYVATLNLAFFFDEVPKELDSSKPIQRVSRAPLMAYVVPRAWRDSE